MVQRGCLGMVVLGPCDGMVVRDRREWDQAVFPYESTRFFYKRTVRACVQPCLSILGTIDRGVSSTTGENRIYRPGVIVHNIKTMYRDGIVSLLKRI
jgi:hypothetical protein